MSQPEPWWANDPVIQANRRRTLEEFEELARREPAQDVPDPVLAEFFDGACWRELGASRDNLANARDRYDAAVLNARTVGMSWGEIGRVLGVSRQELHRRYSRPKPGATVT